MEPQLFLLPDTSAPAPDVQADANATSNGGPGQEKIFSTEGSPVGRRLDDRTRALGYQGIAQARAALQKATSWTADAPAVEARHQPAA